MPSKNGSNFSSTIAGTGGRGYSMTHNSASFGNDMIVDGIGPSSSSESIGDTALLASEGWGTFSESYDLTTRIDRPTDLTPLPPGYAYFDGQKRIHQSGTSTESSAGEYHLREIDPRFLYARTTTATINGQTRSGGYHAESDPNAPRGSLQDSASNVSMSLTPVEGGIEMVLNGQSSSSIVTENFSVNLEDQIIRQSGNVSSPAGLVTYRITGGSLLRNAKTEVKTNYDGYGMRFVAEPVDPPSAGGTQANPGESQVRWISHLVGTRTDKTRDQGTQNDSINTSETRTVRTPVVDGNFQNTENYTLIDNWDVTLTKSVYHDGNDGGTQSIGLSALEDKNKAKLTLNTSGSQDKHFKPMVAGAWSVQEWRQGTHTSTLTANETYSAEDSITVGFDQDGWTEASGVIIQTTKADGNLTTKTNAEGEKDFKRYDYFVPLDEVMFGSGPKACASGGFVR